MALKTNLEMLNEKATALGYTGAPFTDDGDALYWIAQTEAHLTPDTPLGIAAIVAENTAAIHDLQTQGKYVGTFISTSEATASTPALKAGDFALIGTGDFLVIKMYNGTDWVEPVKSFIKFGKVAFLPTNMSPDAKGSVYFTTDTNTLYMWDGHRWIFETKTATVDGFDMKII